MRVKIWDVFINLWIAVAIELKDKEQLLCVNYWAGRIDYELSNEEWEITVLPKVINYLNEK